ncbi:MAG TPA: hypothetical protein VHG91_04645 [Longimicrobium sp.]|nr:hypothetical protein [Longimicrobium sp.]
MHFPRALRPAAALALLLAASACGGARRARPGTEPPPEVQIVVENNLPIPAPLTVYVLPENGGRLLLGTVPGATTASFRYRPVNLGFAHRLVARTTSGDDLRSDLFRLSGKTRLVWSVRDNLLVTER